MRVPVPPLKMPPPCQLSLMLLLDIVELERVRVPLLEIPAPGALALLAPEIVTPEMPTLPPELILIRLKLRLASPLSPLMVTPIAILVLLISVPGAM